MQILVMVAALLGGGVAIYFIIGRLLHSLSVGRY